ncbi:hypothetical protein GCM10023210_20580 [Chryseobacterium ginsengisoli]|uniref:Uncharacterized protein n=1 Tax=Chryseobacterium ginsengisoli TaxID=363853 RepID=A0ABP9M9N5_9FLAO
MTTSDTTEDVQVLHIAPLAQTVHDADIAAVAEPVEFAAVVLREEVLLQKALQKEANRRNTKLQNRVNLQR